jgi:hypothetical protein
MKIIRANLQDGSMSVVEIQIDDCDLPYLSQWKWHINCNGYAYRQFRDETGKCTQTFMHRIIAETPEGFFTDHINKNKLDNRRENLRVVTKSQNAINSKQRKSASGKTGIRLYKDGRITARLTIDRKEIHLGSFATLEDAVIARKSAANKYHGEYQPKL